MCMSSGSQNYVMGKLGHVDRCQAMNSNVGWLAMMIAVMIVTK